MLALSSASYLVLAWYVVPSLILVRAMRKRALAEALYLEFLDLD